MRPSVFCFALIAFSSTVSASELPFSLSANTPDYVANTVATFDSHTTPAKVLFRIQHHQGWTHVEERAQGQVEFAYGNFLKHLLLRGGRESEAGDITWISLTDVDPLKDYLGIKNVVESGIQEVFGNERCRWRELVRRAPNERDYGPYWHACLTEDGIEIATKVLSHVGKDPMSQEKISELTRQPVEEADIVPPAQALDVHYWLKPLRTYSKAPADAVDFEAHLKGGRFEVTLLRHYPWWLSEKRGTDGSFELKVWNPLEEQGISYSIAKGDRRLFAYRRPIDPKRRYNHFDLVTGRVKGERTQTVLGEKCQWYNLAPDVMDASHSRCETQDGIPLIDDYSSDGWGNGERFEVTRFTRRAVDMRELVPSQQYLGSASWGFPSTN